jgi:peptidoglycan/LPS O-acetylase OafA/YrhL
MQSQREGYLDGMKGLACLFILLGHFTGIYKYAENASQIDSWFVRILTEGPVSIFTAESFWLYLFFVISGYLLIISTPRKIRDFLVKCAKRILRLAIPIWGTAIFIFVIQNTIGFYNHSVQAIVQNTWLTHLYGSRLTVLDILKEPFFVLILGTSKFNSPFWCLRDMLISSFLIYGVGWICKSKKTETIAVCVLTVLAAITGRSIIMACLCGSCARLLREKAEIQNKKNIMVLAGLLLPLVAFWSGNPVFTSTAFASFLIAVPQVERMKSIFECKVVKRLGAVSFGIYALHWPIINSIGLRIIVMSTNKMRADMMMIASLLCCSLITLVLATILTVEKLTEGLCKRIH